MLIICPINASFSTVNKLYQINIIVNMKKQGFYFLFQVRERANNMECEKLTKSQLNDNH